MQEKIMFFTTANGKIFVFLAKKDGKGKVIPFGPGYYRDMGGKEIPNAKQRGKRPSAVSEILWAKENWDNPPTEEELADAEILKNVLPLFSKFLEDKKEPATHVHTPFADLRKVIGK